MNIKLKFQKYQEWIYVILVYIIAVLLRLRANFGSELTPSVDGMYYPLQVRHFLETWHLGFPDMPFAFWLEALIARFIHLISGNTLDADIIFSCKLTDSIIPPLAILPLYFLSRLVIKDQKSKLFLILVLGYAVLNPSLLVLLVTDMHKNAIGAIWVFTCLYFIYSTIQNGKMSRFIMVFITAILTAITHIGCFSVLLLFIIVLITAGLIKNPQIVKKSVLKKDKLFYIFLIIPAIVAAGFSTLYLSDSVRISRLFNFVIHPARLFDNSVIGLIIHKQSPLQGPRFIYFIILNLFSVFALLVFFKIRKKLDNTNFVFFLSVVIWQLLLTSPLIGIEWAERIYFLSFIPFTILLLFTFTFLSGWPLKFSVVFFSLFLAFVVVTSPPKRDSFISKQEYSALASLRSQMKLSEKSIIITKHGLEWWTGWILNCKTGQPSGLKKEDMKLYTHIYYLIQKQTNNSKSRSKFFEEVALPPDAKKVAENDSFALYCK
jgi:hypothetical protein